ncbi:hypothetical protein [Acinetobacter boissieri]|uniref:Uncharacterized protein n=1 Tax=Acinetobacter boissieri TaxID=1219383 RepID=A0A1G6GUK1_9GAMM|nr:hypothetical protein [Acinetobacter boissieri]SDB85720.1 hypothetical protein SAMN05421733_102262 [Acinetobacter boissieri]
MYEYNYRTGWGEAKYDFSTELNKEVEALGEPTTQEQAIEQLGYICDQSLFFNPENSPKYITVLIAKDVRTDLYQYIVIFALYTDSVEYFGVTDTPSLIELLGKLVPLVQY